jgi:hypothetical protein
MFGDGDIPEETENGGAFAELPEKIIESEQGLLAAVNLFPPPQPPPNPPVLKPTLPPWFN